MFIVNGVNLFPSDIEVVVREVPELSGEYRITLTTEQHLTRFQLEVESRPKQLLSESALTGQLQKILRNRHGIAPGSVTIHPDGTLPRAVHKAQRVIDKRNGQQ
jgi:phenylacetate-CoA ligase